MILCLRDTCGVASGPPSGGAGMPGLKVSRAGARGSVTGSAGTAGEPCPAQGRAEFAKAS